MQESAAPKTGAAGSFLHTKCNTKKCRRCKALTAFIFTYYFELFLCGSILFLIIGNEAKLKIFAA